MATSMLTPPLDLAKSSPSCKSPPDGHPYLFSDIAHSKAFLSNLSNLRQHEEFCDMTLVVGNTSITTHKVVLASCSPYFRAMFTGIVLSKIMINNYFHYHFSKEQALES